MGKKQELPWSPIRELMKSVGAQIVARDAVDLMRNKLIEIAKETTASALKLTRHAKRTKLTKSDIEMIFKLGK